jgi:2-dehydro-3-deoxygluconokinase
LGDKCYNPPLLAIFNEVIAMTTYDVVTLGETMLRLTPPLLLRLEQTKTFDIEIGGSESNLSVGLVRLGMRVAWLSRLTSNAPGRMIANQIRAFGVDISHVVWTPHDRIGIYYLEEGKAPRGSQVIYDRANSAMSRMSPDDLPQDLFQPDRAKILHLSGITLALSDSASKTAYRAAALAKAAGWRISFDINYRARLWSAADAVAGCDAMANMTDILFMPLRDAQSLYGAPENVEDALHYLRERYPSPNIVLTTGEEGAVGLTADGTIHHQRAFPAEAVGRVGGGDAFVSGFLYGYLTHDTLADGLLWGTAAAAFKYSVPGDIPLFTYEELAQLVKSGEGGSLRR